MFWKCIVCIGFIMALVCSSQAAVLSFFFMLAF